MHKGTHRYYVARQFSAACTWPLENALSMMFVFTGRKYRAATGALKAAVSAKVKEEKRLGRLGIGPFSANHTRVPISHRALLNAAGQPPTHAHACSQSI